MPRLYSRPTTHPTAQEKSYTRPHIQTTSRKHNTQAKSNSPSPPPMGPTPANGVPPPTKKQNKKTLLTMIHQFIEGPQSEPSIGAHTGQEPRQQTCHSPSTPAQGRHTPRTQSPRVHPELIQEQLGHQANNLSISTDHLKACMQLPEAIPLESLRSSSCLCLFKKLSITNTLTSA